MAQVTSYTLGTGESRYMYRIRLKGHPTVTRGGFRTKTAAAKAARALEEELRSGLSSGALTSRRMTVAELLDRYESEIVPHLKPSTQVLKNLTIAWTRTNFGQLALAVYATPTTFHRIVAQYRKENPGLKSGSIGRYLSDHIAFVNAAIRWKLLDKNSEIRKSDVFSARPVARERYLTDAEIQQLVAECDQSMNPNLGLLVRLALSTGARKNELLTLKWADIDWTRGTVKYSGEKTDSPRTVGLTPEMLELLRQHPRQLRNELVFPGAKGGVADIQTAWEKAKQRAGLEDFHFHDLRHTCASLLAKAGVPLLNIGKVLGHKSIQMTQRYSHLCPDEIADSALVAGDAVARALGNGAGK